MIDRPRDICRTTASSSRYLILAPAISVLPSPTVVVLRSTQACDESCTMFDSHILLMDRIGNTLFDTIGIQVIYLLYHSHDFLKSSLFEPPHVKHAQNPSSGIPSSFSFANLSLFKSLHHLCDTTSLSFCPFSPPSSHGFGARI